MPTIFDIKTLISIVFDKKQYIKKSIFGYLLILTIKYFYNCIILSTKSIAQMSTQNRFSLQHVQPTATNASIKNAPLLIGIPKLFKLSDHYGKLQSKNLRYDQAIPLNMRQDTELRKAPKQAEKKNLTDRLKGVKVISSKPKVESILPRDQNSQNGQNSSNSARTSLQLKHEQIQLKQSNEEKLLQENQNLKQECLRQRQEIEKLNQQASVLKSALDAKVLKEKGYQQKINRLNEGLQKSQRLARESFYCQLQRKKMSQQYKELVKKHESQMVKKEELQTSLKLSYNQKATQQKLIAELQTKVKSYQSMEEEFNSLKDLSKRAQQYRLEAVALKEKLQAYKTSGQTHILDKDRLKAQNQRLQTRIKEGLTREEQLKGQLGQRKSLQANLANQQKIAKQWEFLSGKQKNIQSLSKKLSELDILINGQTFKQIKVLTAEIGKLE